MIKVSLFSPGRVLICLQAACSLSLGLGEDSIHASSVLVMPMVSSKITGFRGNRFDKTKDIFSARPELE